MGGLPDPLPPGGVNFFKINLSLMKNKRTERPGPGRFLWWGGPTEVDKREKPPFNGFLTIEFLFYHKLYQTVPSITKNGARLRSCIWLARHQKGLP